MGAIAIAQAAVSVTSAASSVEAANTLAADVLGVNGSLAAAAARGDSIGEAHLLLGAAQLLNRIGATDGRAGLAAEARQRGEGWRRQLRDNLAAQLAASRLVSVGEGRTPIAAEALESAASILQQASGSPAELPPSAANTSLEVAGKLLSAHLRRADASLTAEVSVGEANATGAALSLATAQALSDVLSSATLAMLPAPPPVVSASAACVAQLVTTLSQASLGGALPDEAAVLLSSDALQLRAQRHRLATLGQGRLTLPVAANGSAVGAAVTLPHASVLAAAVGSTIVDTQLSTVAAGGHESATSHDSTALLSDVTTFSVFAHGARVPLAVREEIVLELPLTHARPLLPNQTAECRFWSPSDGARPVVGSAGAHADWSGVGCRPLNTEGGRLLCGCNHTTDFAALVVEFLPSDAFELNGFTAADIASALSADSLAANPYGLVLVSGILILWLLVGRGIRARHRSRTHSHAASLHSLGGDGTGPRAISSSSRQQLEPTAARADSSSSHQGLEPSAARADSSLESQ